MAKHTFTGTTGLPLPRRALRALKDRGIFAHPLVSVELDSTNKASTLLDSGKADYLSLIDSREVVRIWPNSSSPKGRIGGAACEQRSNRSH
jgi:hypothetical protein